MKLHWSPRSPFVRKVMIAAYELGLADRIACVRTVVATTRPHAPLMEENPLSKIPTLILDDGTVLYDSPVICEYLDSLHSGRKLVPRDGKERMASSRRAIACPMRPRPTIPTVRLRSVALLSGYPFCAHLPART